MQQLDPHMDTLNAAVRFLVLELGAAWGIVAGVRHLAGSWLWAVPAVLVAMWLWATFRVPDDPGPAPRPVSGRFRLAIEGVVLGAGAAGLWLAHGPLVGGVYLLVMVVHYATTRRRLRWVLSFRS